MEEAIFISHISGLKYLSDKHSRLYFGNEFCEQLLPTVEELRTALSYVQKERLDFTFVTPYLTNNGIGQIRASLEFLFEKSPEAEIVVNDWGLYRFMRRRFGKRNFLLGRLLTKQKRGPRILNLIGKVPETMLEHFKCSAVDQSPTAEFLANSGICRIELDNLLQGILRGSSIQASLYIPFAYVTTTRYCLYASWKNSESRLRAIRRCHKECRDYAFRLRHRNMPVELLLKGNTQFFENKTSPPNLEELNIDRIVYEPELPV